MAQVNVDLQFDSSLNTYFSVDGSSDNFALFDFDNFIVESRIYKESEAFRKDIELDYKDFYYSTYGIQESYEFQNFDLFKIEYKARSGQCADVSLIQEYRFRAYNTNLNQYVFWSAGTKDFSESVTGYDPAFLENITILFIN